MYTPLFGDILLLVVAFLSSYLLLKWWKKSKELPPGPIGLPVLGYLPFLGKNPAQTFLNLTSKYGDIFSLYLGSRYTVVLNNYRLIKEVFTNSASNNNPPAILGEVIMGLSNNSVWTEERRFIQFALRELGIGRKIWETKVQDEIRNFINKLISNNGKPTVIDEELRMSLLNINLAFIFGHDFDDNESKNGQLANQFVRYVFSHSGPSDPTILFPPLRKLFKFLKIGGYNEASRVINEFFHAVKQEISRHKLSPEAEGNEDFISHYLQQIRKMEKSPKLNKIFNEENLIGDVNTLILGSTDTVWCSLSWVIRLLAQHKDVQDKVYNEIIEVLGKDSIALYEKRNRIPYTFAVLMEMERYSSIAPLGAPRELDKDMKINGYTIPKGTQVLPNFWALHHDPIYWDEPEIFRPQRFLSTDRKTLVKDHRNYVPFSLGKRNCPGELIAWKIMLMYVTEIVKNFEIRAPDCKEIELNVVYTYLSLLKPQNLCFVKRDS